METLGCASGDSPIVAVATGSYSESLKPVNDSEWHSISLDDANKATLEYCFQVLQEEGTEMSVVGREGNNANLDLEMRGGLDLALCCLSKCGDGEQGNYALEKYPNFAKSDRAFVTVEAIGGVDLVKEVRVRFHVLEDGLRKVQKAATVELFKHFGAESLCRVDDGCFSIVSRVVILVSGAKQSLHGFISRVTRVSIWHCLSSYLRPGYTSPLCSPRKPTLSSRDRSTESSLKTNNPVSVRYNAESIDASQERKNVEVSIQLLHAKADDCIAGQLQENIKSSRMREGESRKSLPRSPSGVMSALHANCKKPPKPPRPASEKRAVRKKIERTLSKRKCRSVQSASATAISPIIAFTLTVIFGFLMVFQGLFLRANVWHSSAGDESIAGAVIEASHGISTLNDLNPDGGSSLVNVVPSDLSVAEAFRKSMFDIHHARHLMSTERNHYVSHS